MMARTLARTTGSGARRRGLLAGQLGALLVLLSGCASWLGFVTYYDPTTYGNLTAAKAETLALYESFTAPEIDDARVDAVRLQLSKAYEYERGKGSSNENTADQIRTLREMFDRAVADRRERGAWSEVNRDNKVELITSAFDIAIATEASKNKNE